MSSSPTTPAPARPSAPVVWITGAAGGLGTALVDEFSRQGWRVAASVHKTPLPARTDSVSSWVTDVRDPASVRVTAEAIESELGPIDVLIHAAGVTADSLLAHMAESSWDEVVDVSLKGGFLCSQAVIRSMAKRRSGHILHISSFAGKRGHAGQANYAAAKAGLIGLTQSMAAELGSRNIQVNAILPGVMQTKMVSGLTENQLASLRDANTLKRLNDPIEVARFIHMLATMKNVSGQVFQLDSRLSRWT